MVCRATLQLQVQETDVQEKVSVTIEESQKHELVERVKIEYAKTGLGSSKLR